MELERHSRNEEQTSAKTRIEWIDSLRGAGILLVCLGHSGISFLLGDCKVWIFSFHLPLFFLISGMLFHEGKYSFGVFLKKRASSLLWPYLTFSILCVLLYAAIPEHPAWGEQLRNILYGYGPEDGLALWFLPLLFLLECIFYILMKIVRQKLFRILLLPLLALAAYPLYKTGLQLPWNAEVIPAALVFFSAGHFFFHPEKLNRLSFIQTVCAFVLFLAASIALGRMVNVDMRTNQLSPYGMFFTAAFAGILATISGILFYAILARKNKILEWGNRFLIFTGRNTIPILALHQLYFLIAFRLHGIPGMAQKALAVAALYMTVVILKRCFPWFLVFPKKHEK